MEGKVKQKKMFKKKVISAQDQDIAELVKFQNKVFFNKSKKSKKEIIFDLGKRTHKNGGWVEYTDNGTIIRLLEDVHKTELSKHTFTTDLEEVMKTQLPENVRIEALSKSHGANLIPVQRSNAFLFAARIAFYNEYDFIINPDDIWLLISQGFGQYVNQNAEELREKIVDFKGEMEILVVNEFKKGDKNNNWETEFPKFGGKVKGYIGEELYENLVADFSTTTPIQKAASEIVLLYSMQKYFKYKMKFGCGIPNFMVEGTITDWELIKSKTQRLMKFGKVEWLTCVVQILDQFIESLQGNMDPKFWNSFYKRDGGFYQGYKILGWVLNLFPYYQNGEENPSSEISWEINIGKEGPDDTSFSSAMCSCPFHWDDGEGKYNMKFMAGICAAQLQGDYLRPYQGWAIVEE